MFVGRIANPSVCSFVDGRIGNPSYAELLSRLDLLNPDNDRLCRVQVADVVELGTSTDRHRVFTGRGILGGGNFDLAVGLALGDIQRLDAQTGDALGWLEQDLHLVIEAVVASDLDGNLDLLALFDWTAGCGDR